MSSSHVFYETKVYNAPRHSFFQPPKLALFVVPLFSFPREPPNIAFIGKGRSLTMFLLCLHAVNFSIRMELSGKDVREEMRV